MSTSKLFYFSRTVEKHHSVNGNQAQIDGLWTGISIFSDGNEKDRGRIQTGGREEGLSLM